MIKKLTFVLFVLIICFNANSQTKLFNDDGTYRTDGIYYINVVDYFVYDYNNMKRIDYDTSKSYFIPIILKDKVSQSTMSNFNYAKGLTGRELINMNVRLYYKSMNNIVNFWSDLNEMKNDILNGEINRNFQIAIGSNDFPQYLYFGLRGHPQYTNYMYFQLFNFNNDNIEYKCVENNNGKIGNTIASSTNKLNFLEIYEMSDDYKQKQFAEAKRIQDEKDRVNAIAQQKANLEAAKLEKINNDKRIAKIKTATIGDRLCYSEAWTYTERSSGFFGIGAYDNSSNYKVIVVAYIEKIVNGKYQVRVGSIESTDKNHYQTPTYKGVKLREESIHWINPITDKNWYYCE